MKLFFYICLADIGDLVVLMAKRSYIQHTDDNVMEMKIRMEQQHDVLFRLIKK